MYNFKDKGFLTEISCGGNFEYQFSDEVSFLSTDYKVIKSRGNDFFVDCTKILRNGRVSIFYESDKYRSFSALFSGIDSDALFNILINIINGIVSIKKNGFLSCSLIDTSWDKIYIDLNTYMPRFVYVPISTNQPQQEFESEFRSNVIKLLNRIIPNPEEKIESFISDLSNGLLPLEEVLVRSRQLLSVGNEKGSGGEKDDLSVKNGLKLIAMNAPSHFEIEIDSDSVLIGKKQEIVDKVVSFNRMISRKHCRISRQNETYFVNDEGSANGTFLNGKKLLPGEKHEISRGDIIRMASSDFQVM